MSSVLEFSAALVVASTSYSKNFDIEPIFTLGAVAVVGPLMNWTISGLLAPALVGRGLVAAFSPHPVVEGYEEVFKAFVARPGNLRQRAYELATLKEELAAIEGHYGEISIPLTAVYGDRDGLPAVEGAQALGRDVDGARVVALAGLGHEIPHLRPAVVAREVRRLSGAVGAN